MIEDDSFTLAVSFPLFFLLLGRNYLNYLWGPLGSVGVISRIHFGFISVHFGFISVHFGFISVHFGSIRFISVISRSLFLYKYFYYIYLFAQKSCKKLFKIICMCVFCFCVCVCVCIFKKFCFSKKSNFRPKF